MNANYLSLLLYLVVFGLAIAVSGLLGWWLDLKHPDIEIIAIVIVLGLLPIYWLPGIVRLFLGLWRKIKWR